MISSLVIFCFDVLVKILEQVIRRLLKPRQRPPDKGDNVQDVSDWVSLTNEEQTIMLAQVKSMIRFVLHQPAKKGLFEDYLLLWRFFLSLFLRLCVEILCLFFFLPFGIIVEFYIIN
jgi:hypothetical protein